MSQILKSISRMQHGLTYDYLPERDEDQLTQKHYFAYWSFAGALAMIVAGVALWLLNEIRRNGKASKVDISIQTEHAPKASAEDWARLMRYAELEY